jgi:hypothetical protein
MQRQVLDQNRAKTKSGGFEELTAKLQLEETKVNAKLRNHLVIAEKYNLLKKSLEVIQCAKSQLALSCQWKSKNRWKLPSDTRAI